MPFVSLTNALTKTFFSLIQVNGNHETINVEGDFRFVDSEGFDECADFLEYLHECDHNWEEPFVNWIALSARWKEDRKKAQWGPWNIVKVLKHYVYCSVFLNGFIKLFLYFSVLK